MILNKATLSEQIYCILKNDILDQTIPMGEKLTLSSLQKRFAISSTPIREALTRLTEEGLVNYYSNVGVTVITLTSKDIEELYQFIGDMDALAIIYASAHPNQEKLLTELSDIVKKTTALSKKQVLTEEEETERINLSDRFHLVFYDYCNNSRLAKAAEKQRSQLTILSKIYQADPAVQKEIENSHIFIYQAYLDKQYEQAAKLMKDHLKQSFQFALTCIPE